MKPQVPVWVALTFLMLMLVLFAALIFMFQGRYALEDRIGVLQGDVTESAEKFASLELETTAEAVALADSQATVAAMEANAEVAQSQLDDLNTTILNLEADATVAVQTARDDAAATLNNTVATLEATMHQPPTLMVDGIPESGVIEPNQPITLVVSASDPQGIQTVAVSVNGEEIAALAGGEERLVAEIVYWDSAEEGSFTVEAVATDADGMLSEPQTFILEVVDRETRLQTLVEALQVDVAEIRGLEFTDPVTLTLYTSAELRENFEEIFGENVTEEEARSDVLELYAFDWIARDYDLYGELTDLYSDSVLGFYDPDTKELVVVSDDGKLSLSQRLTLVHELAHALQDQVYGLDLGGGVDEENFAFRALVEGEASLVELLYITEGYMSNDEIQQLIEEFENSEASDLGDFPEVIVNAQQFPYIDGTAFVEALYQQGQFDLINETWDAPPTTSEQVLHLELFEAGEAPRVVSVPTLTPTLGTGWEFIAEDVLGEFYISEYLDVELDEADSDEAAAGWGGDRYAIYWNEAQQQIVLLLRTEWDLASENNQFVQAYIEYATRKYDVDPIQEADGALCWQGEDITCLYQSDAGATVVRAPSRELVLEIVALP